MRSGSAIAAARLRKESGEGDALDRSVRSLLDGLSPEVRTALLASLEGAPPDLRRTFESSLTALERLLEKDPRAAVEVLATVRGLFDPLLDPLARVAVVGAVNVGKSSLYNTLAPADQQAATSPVPGTTRAVQQGEVGLFHLIDTPGADRADAPEERQQALDAAATADALLVVLDATRGVTVSDKTLHHTLAALGKRMLVVINKIDCVAEKDRRVVIEAAAKALGVNPLDLVSTSATRGIGIQKLVLELAAVEPRLLGHLGKALVPMRRQLAWQAVRRAATGAALVALTPLPMIDLIPLAAIQLSLVLTVARIYGRPMGVGAAGQSLGSIGAGVLARSLFTELAKLGGVPGWVLSASVAASATVAIGYSAIVLNETGQRPKKAQVEQMTRSLQGRFARLLGSLGRRKPKRAQVTQMLDEAFPLPDALQEAP